MLNSHTNDAKAISHGLETSPTGPGRLPGRHRNGHPDNRCGRPIIDFCPRVVDLSTQVLHLGAGWHFDAQVMESRVQLMPNFLNLCNLSTQILDLGSELVDLVAHIIDLGAQITDLGTPAIDLHAQT